MTKIVEVSQKEMGRRTGMPQALGYSQPTNALILIRKGLPAKTRKEVLEHEAEHMINGEEGPFLPQLLSFGASLVGSLGAKSASDTSADLAREGRAEARADLAPWRQTGEEAQNYLWDLLQGKTSMSEALARDPSYRFRVAEGEQGQYNLGKATGMRLSGRALKGMERFRQGLASSEGSNFLNRLQQLSQTGQAAAAGQASATQTGTAREAEARTMGAEGINQAVQGGVQNYLALKQQQDLLKAIGGGRPGAGGSTPYGQIYDTF